MTQKPVASGKSSFNLIDKNRFFKEVEKAHSPVIADFACGIGNYSIALAKKDLNNKIFAVDLWEQGIISLEKEVEQSKIKNIKPILADLSKDIPIKNESIDLGIIATIVHDLIQEKFFTQAMINISSKIKQSGLIFVLEFKKIIPPPGPPKEVRLEPNELKRIIEPYGFLENKVINLGEYIYLSSFKKV